MKRKKRVFSRHAKKQLPRIRQMKSEVSREIELREAAEKVPLSQEVMEKALVGGDLMSLNPQQRLNLYSSVCASLGLNPLTRPFEYIVLNNRLTIYARKDCTDQLRKIHNVSVRIVSRDIQDGIYIVTAQATLPNKRQDEAIGCVKIENTTGDARANAMMKAETKAKRRVTLSISGLGIFDASELESMHGIEFEPDESIQTRIAQANANREQFPAQVPSVEGNAVGSRVKPASELPLTDDSITEQNYGDIVCHVGKAEGPALGRKVSELPFEVIKWLSDNFGVKWAKPATAKDVRLRVALAMAIKHRLDPEHVRKPSATAQDRAGNVETPPDASTQQPKLETNEGVAIHEGEAATELRRLTNALPMSESAFCELLGKHKVIDGSQSTFTDLSDSQIAYLLDNWGIVKGLVEIERS